MLDFYFIKDTQPQPDTPDGLEFAGALDDKAFTNLQKKSIIDNRLDYCGDFRWTTTDLKQIHQKSTPLHDTDVAQLLHIIILAENKQTGLMAFGD